MKIGFIAIGIGLAADPEVLRTIAQTTEECGFHSLWAPEHVVLFDQYSARYPYAEDGRLPMPTTVDFLDPFSALTFAAAHTKTIRLGTGICLVPERNPLITAKEVASVDKLSGGRFDFGVGIGWLKEEFGALGTPWERRAERTREYLAAMKLLWTQEEPQFKGEFCAFPRLRMYPKPVQKPHPPILIGGESVPALKRAGEVGDGWFGVNVTIEHARTKIARIKEFARAIGRDADRLHFFVSPGLGVSVELDSIKRYRDAGVDQVIVGTVSMSSDSIKKDIEQLGEKLVAPASRL
jgi:probable F420-dependent oxidoreductase